MAGSLDETQPVLVIAIERIGSPGSEVGGGGATESGQAAAREQLFLVHDGRSCCTHWFLPSPSKYRGEMLRHWSNLTRASLLGDQKPTHTHTSVTELTLQIVVTAPPGG